MKIKTINIICAYYIPHVGGVEKFVSNQKKELTKLGFQVNIITSNSDNLSFEENNNGKIYRLSALDFSPKLPMPLPYNIFQIVKVFTQCFLKRNTLTIIHTRYYPSSLLGTFMGGLVRSKTIVIDHSSGYISFNNKYLDAISKLYEHLMTFIIKLFRPRFYGVSKACNEWLKTFGIKASGVYYNGIDFGYELKETFDVHKKHNIGPYIFYAGRLIKEKGIIELLNGFESFSKVNPDYHLLIAGNGLLANEVDSCAKKNSKIIFLGRLGQDEVFNYIKDAWVFVNPSNYPEGLPTVLLESGKFETAVISTPNGGAKEIIVDRETGILISSGQADLIKEALQLISDNEMLRQKIAKNLYNLVKNQFDWPIITKNFLTNILTLENEKN